MSFSDDSATSIRLFQKFSVPAMKFHFGSAAQIFSTENHESDLEKVLDFAGIDGVISDSDGTIYFFASRVQVGRNYQSFSLRGYRPTGKPTEYQKLQRARRTNAVMPTYHVQSFVDSAEKKGVVAIAQTVDLLKFVENQNPEIRTAPTSERFFVIPWQNLCAGSVVKIYRVDCGGLVEDLTADFSASA